MSIKAKVCAITRKCCSIGRANAKYILAVLYFRKFIEPVIFAHSRFIFALRKKKHHIGRILRYTYNDFAHIRNNVGPEQIFGGNSGL